MGRPCVGSLTPVSNNCASHGAICIVASWREAITPPSVDYGSYVFPFPGRIPNLVCRTNGRIRFLYYAIQQKDLPTIRVGRCRLITEKALREWLERKTEATVETKA